MAVELAQITQFLKNLYPFRKLTPDQLQQAAGMMTSVVLEPGQKVYEQDDEATFFCFVFSGQIKLTSYRYRQEDHLATYNSGDWFGEDGLRLGHTRQTTAAALGSAIILQITTEDMQELCDLFPSVRNALGLIEDTYHLFLQVNLDWRAPEEVVYYFSRRSPLFLIPGLALPGGLSLIALPFLYYAALVLAPSMSGLLWLAIALTIFLLGWCALAVVDWGNDYFLVTNRRAIYLERVILLYDSRQETPLDAILSIGTQTDQWGRWLNYGGVQIKTYTGTIPFTRISRPQEVYYLLETQWLLAKANRQREERRTMRDIVRRRLNPEAPPLEQISPDQPQEPRIRSGTLTAWLDHIYGLRTEADGNIIYRTHWWRLFTRTAIPSFITVASVALLIVRILGGLSALPEALVLIVSLSGFLVAGGFWLYRYLDWENDRYIITQDQLIDVYKKPLGLEERRAAPLKNIQSIDSARKGIIGLLLNFGTVTILIGNEKLTFDDVPAPSQVQQEIFMRFIKFTDKAKLAEQQRIVDWLEAYDQVREDETES